jgi:hypothetical protein
MSDTSEIENTEKRLGVVADIAHNITVKTTKNNVLSQWLTISYSIL